MLEHGYVKAGGRWLKIEPTREGWGSLEIDLWEGGSLRQIRNPQRKRENEGKRKRIRERVWKRESKERI
jgi:hypothetical protein